jgi:DNA repair protein RecN (Recombination protein N)
MLRELKINNLALIDSLHLVLGSETGNDNAAFLTVLTGETGAGKSIILQALNLLSAGKASAAWIRTGADSAMVEALFEITPDKEELLENLRNKGFEIDNCLIIKRVLNKSGRSRYYLNNSMATAALLGEISENLFSVASQHDHQLLLNSKNHLDFIDAVGELWSQRQKFGEIYANWSHILAQHKELQQMDKDREQRRDLLTFQLKEIKDADISPAEDEMLGAEKKRLKASDTLMELGRTSYHLLSESIVIELSQVRKNLEQMVQMDETISDLTERVASSNYELDDLAAQLNKYIHDIPSDPAELELVEMRIDLLQKLKRKYGTPQGLLSEVILFGENAAEELASLDSMDIKLADLTKALEDIETKLLKEADALSNARQKTAKDLEKLITGELSTLSFATADFRVHFHPVDRGLRELTPTGWDRPEFLFSANPGEPVKPLIKIASGGELSRLLLGLKCILARKDQVDTVIFDEVDAGIGGQAAEDIAVKIRELAGHHQVLCISHLPQIASKADEHFMVDKKVQNGRTQTDISLLEHDKRVNELARMLAGDTVTDQTLAFAREMLGEKQVKG